MAPDGIAVGVSQGDVEHERIGIRGRVRLSRADRCRAVGRCWPAGATTRLFRRRLTVQDHGRSDQLRALHTYHAIVLSHRSIVEIISLLELSWFLGACLLRERNMLRKITIALITLTAVSLDPLLARMEGWRRYLGRRRR
jgi:hypothetical protein